MALEAITYEKESGIATITLNRPKQLNAVGGPMSAELQRTLEEANTDKDVRVLIVTGAGKGFCSGAEVSGLGTLADTDSSSWSLSAKSPAAGGIRSFIVPFYNFEKPIIAAVNGIAAGGGFSIALACDIRIASDRARFSQIFIKRGLVPDTGSTYYLPRVVGVSKAAEMVFTGEILGAEEARECGIVSRVVPHDELLPAARELAGRIAANPPLTMKLAKRALYKGAASDFDSALEFEGFMQGICFATEDFREGVAAFMEKREANFKGR
jgi:2-(1,2-epoxy-1,2-dihydrophenyl)acetyl-CoA isomerase